MAAMAGGGDLVGYFGGECPRGGGTHLLPVYVTSSSGMPVLMSAGWPADTAIELCAACLTYEPGGVAVLRGSRPSGTAQSTAPGPSGKT